MAYFLNQRNDDAIIILERAIGRHPQHLPLHIALAAAYADSGRLEDAKRAAAEIRGLHPFFAADQYGEAFRAPRIANAFARACARRGFSVIFGWSSG